MICYKLEFSQWWIFFSFFKYPLQDLLSGLKAIISTNESTEFITGLVIYNSAYTYKILTENHLNVESITATKYATPLDTMIVSIFDKQTEIGDISSQFTYDCTS